MESNKLFMVEVSASILILAEDEDDALRDVSGVNLWDEEPTAWANEIKTVGELSDWRWDEIPHGSEDDVTCAQFLKRLEEETKAKELFEERDAKQMKFPFHD